VRFPIIALTSPVGALLGSPVADSLGRKWGIIIACAVFSAGVAMQTAAVHLPLFVAGRVIAGLGVGLVSVLIPMYQSEWFVGCFSASFKFHRLPTQFPEMDSWRRCLLLSVGHYDWASPRFHCQ
jgi:hypothetical protein